MNHKRWRRHPRRSFLAAPAASLLALFAIPGNASGGLAGAPATFWKGTTDGTWTGANWASDLAGTPTNEIPTSASDITFSVPTAQNQNTTLGRDFTIHSLTISDPVAVTINSGANTNTLRLAGNAGAGLDVQLGAGLTTIHSNLTLSGHSDTITVNNTAGAVIRGSLGGAYADGTYGFIKNGTGTLTLAGPSTYTGNTTVYAGTLAIDNNGSTAFGTLGVVGTGGILVYGSSATESTGGTIRFLNSAAAGEMFFQMYGGTIANGRGASVEFDASSTADRSLIYAYGGPAVGGSGSSLNFRDSATAGHSQITVFGTTAADVSGGRVSFYESSGGGSSFIYIYGGVHGGIEGGGAQFFGSSTADRAFIYCEGFPEYLGSAGSAGGKVEFFDQSAAGDAAIALAAGKGGGSVDFHNTSTAANARITGQAGTTAGTSGGSINFHDASSAGNAMISVWGSFGDAAAGGTATFKDSSNAGSATIVALGGEVRGAGGGIVQFDDFSSASNATLIAGGGIHGGEGGAIYFKGFSSGAAAVVQLSGNAKLDISERIHPLGSIGSIEGSGNVFLGANYLGVSSITGNKTFSGVIQDGGRGGGEGGTFEFFSTGTLNLTGANKHTGATIVFNGTLAAGNAKAFGSGNLVVLGGTVRTTGGPLSVDMGAGNIFFGGDITSRSSQPTDGSFIANVGGTTPGVTHDQIRTTGTAKVYGLRLELVQLNNFHLNLGDKVVLISALGGIASGTPEGIALLSFSDIGGVPHGAILPHGLRAPESGVTGIEAFGTGLLIPVVNVYPTSVVLELMQGTFGALARTLSFTPNQSAISGALDQLLPQIGSNPEVAKAFQYFDTLHASDIPALLEQLNPAAFTSAFNLSTALANIQTSNIQQRLADIRASAGEVFPVNSVNVSAGSDRVGANGPAEARAKVADLPMEERSGLWMTGSGEFVHIGGLQNGAGLDLDSGGVTAGVDYRFTDHFAAGISLGYMNTSANLPGGGKMDVDGGRIGAYATYFRGELHLDAAVSSGPNSYATHRATPGNTAATASPGGAEVNVLFAAGYDRKWKAVTLGPTASIQYTTVQLDGFTERAGIAPLNVATANSESLRSALGFRASIDKRIGRAIVRPEVRAAWQHEFGDVSHSLTASFATLGGTPFTVTGPTTGRDSMLLTAGFSVQWNGRFATYAYYDAELFRTNYSSNNVSVGFRYQF